MQEKIIILDFGSQTTQLIARRIRELNVYCEILTYNNIPHSDTSIKGVILSGSPFSVYDKNAFKTNIECLRGKLPILGICYGAQLMAHEAGGMVTQADTSREYGCANLLQINANDELLNNVKQGSQVWMSHGDTITSLPAAFKIIASTAQVQCAAYKIDGEPTWGVQFHPEVYHSQCGTTMLENFVKICKCQRDWTPASFIESSVKKLQEMLNNDKVVMALSGGVDSSVAAVLLHRAIGDNLHCIFVDNGLLRKNEYEDVMLNYANMNLNIKGIDAQERFYTALQRISSPEEKRKIIGKTFIDVFEEEAGKLKNVKWLAQGTIYPDCIESLSITGTTIKSHHNVGGLPARMRLQLVEPLRLLFKDEVRRTGRALGMSDALIGRHPFPGPGLGVRILGEVTAEKVRILQQADHIFVHGLRSQGLYEKVWQAGAILLPVRSVGVMGDERTYENAIVLRAVQSTDGMTADWTHLPYDFLAKISNEIINKVKGINRVAYDISSKPPATIEWE